MEKIISGITRALLTELILLIAIFCWNWLGANLLPDFLQMFLVFQNVGNFVISTATSYLNILGIIIACMLRGWLYLFGHKIAFERLQDECYLTSSESLMYNSLTAVLCIIGVLVFGFPDKGDCFVAAYIISFIFAIFLYSKK